ncbi:hypothetical protein E3N88_37774 [Mikania micrantha]|uniref:Uncharacterized protein n=1 Tax=Mikania micrantha TaxID=192012 RepID=A0A5N6LS05_9ASTR|nr:hypothetical protein E3N88_37774 [Mikania micrantha]
MLRATLAAKTPLGVKEKEVMDNAATQAFELCAWKELAHEEGERIGGDDDDFSLSLWFKTIILSYCLIIHDDVISYEIIIYEALAVPSPNLTVLSPQLCWLCQTNSKSYKGSEKENYSFLKPLFLMAKESVRIRDMSSPGKV